MKRSACFVLALLSLANTLPAATPLKRISGGGGETVAVIVPADVAIQHTRQYFDSDPANLLAELELAPGRAVKLNVVAATPAAADAAREAVKKHFAPGTLPAVSMVVGALPGKFTVAMDAIVAAGAIDPAPKPRLFISGQAELVAKSPAEAAAKTLAGLRETLEFFGCKAADVVQAKCFLTPMSAMPQVLREFEASIPELDHRLVFVEWKSEIPVEIELVAIAPMPAPGDAPAVEYLTPPGKTASPLFARVVRVNRGELIYIGDLYSETAGDGANQVNSIFAQLQDVLKQTGSDLRHLVKATYYVSDDDASKQLNAIRPKFYDPQRPPAASKAVVPAVGRRDRSISIDMIAIPASQPTSAPARP
jgi:enamine deaminase RidA (YjgF/YER057c/UK114 family)